MASAARVRGQVALHPMVTALNTPGRHGSGAARGGRVPGPTDTGLPGRLPSGVRRTAAGDPAMPAHPQAPRGTADAAQALVLQGMGGLGKSTLASRLLERIAHPPARRLVRARGPDQVSQLTSKVGFRTMDQQIEATGCSTDDEVDLGVRLRYLCHGPLEQIPCLSCSTISNSATWTNATAARARPRHGADPSCPAQSHRRNQQPKPGHHHQPLPIPLPPGTTVRVEALETLTDVEQVKKVANLPTSGPRPPYPPRSKTGRSSRRRQSPPPRLA